MARTSYRKGIRNACAAFAFFTTIAQAICIGSAHLSDNDRLSSDLMNLIIEFENQTEPLSPDQVEDVIARMGTYVNTSLININSEFFYRFAVGITTYNDVEKKIFNEEYIIVRPGYVELVNRNREKGINIEMNYDNILSNLMQTYLVMNDIISNDSSLYIQVVGLMESDHIPEIDSASCNIVNYITSDSEKLASSLSFRLDQQHSSQTLIVISSGGEPYITETTILPSFDSYGKVEKTEMFKFLRQCVQSMVDPNSSFFRESMMQLEEVTAEHIPLGLNGA